MQFQALDLAKLPIEIQFPRVKMASRMEEAREEQLGSQNPLVKKHYIELSTDHLDDLLDVQCGQVDGVQVCGETAEAFVDNLESKEDGCSVQSSHDEHSKICYLNPRVTLDALELSRNHLDDFLDMQGGQVDSLHVCSATGEAIMGSLKSNEEYQCVQSYDNNHDMSCYSTTRATMNILGKANEFGTRNVNEKIINNKRQVPCIVDHQSGHKKIVIHPIKECSLRCNSTLERCTIAATVGQGQLQERPQCETSTTDQGPLQVRPPIVITTVQGHPQEKSQRPLKNRRSICIMREISWSMGSNINIDDVTSQIKIVPKRSRRDGKPATERTSTSNRDIDSVDRTDGEYQKHRRRLQDALPLEPLLDPESKGGRGDANRELNKNTDEPLDSSKHSSDPTEIPRSRSCFQHDERGSAGQAGRSFSRRTTEHGLGSNSMDRSNDRVGDRTGVHTLPRRNERPQMRGDDNAWRHDGFFELEADTPASPRKRPAFREKKLETEPANAADIALTYSARDNRQDRPAFGYTRREEKGDQTRDLDRPRRPISGDRIPSHRGETRRVGFSSRERFGGSNSFRQRDSFSGRHGERDDYPTNSLRTEKWKHDLFDEANRSPTSKTEEDQIAKVEALLASS